MLKLKLFPLVFLVCYPEVKIKFCNETIKVGQTSLFAPQPCAPVSGQYMFWGSKRRIRRKIDYSAVNTHPRALKLFFLDRQLNSASDALIFVPLCGVFEAIENFYKKNVLKKNTKKKFFKFLGPKKLFFLISIWKIIILKWKLVIFGIKPYQICIGWISIWGQL